MTNLSHSEDQIQRDRDQVNSKFPLFADLFAKDEQTTRGQQIYGRWKAFHENNRRIFELFCEFTFELIRAGRDHYSADAVFHRIRWHCDIETVSEDSAVKLNNDFTSLYARLFHSTYPHHGDFFRTRRRISEDKPGYVIDNPVTDFGPPAHEAGLEHSLSEVAHLNSPGFARR